MNLKQDEILELGRLDFPMAFLVTLRIVSPMGEPVEGVRAGCCDADGFLGAYRGRFSPYRSKSIYIPIRRVT